MTLEKIKRLEYDSLLKHTLKKNSLEFKNNDHELSNDLKNIDLNCNKKIILDPHSDNSNNNLSSGDSSSESWNGSLNVESRLIKLQSKLLEMKDNIWDSEINCNARWLELVVFYNLIIHH